MPHDQPPTLTNRPVWLYVLLGAIVAALLIWGLLAYRGHHQTQEANAKAQQLQQKLRAAGLPAYASTHQIARTFGTDGGAVCDTPGKSIPDGFVKLQLSNGAGGPGQRPVRVARELVEGQLLVIETYCPDKLPAYRKFVDSLHFKDVIRR